MTNRARRPTRPRTAGIHALPAVPAVQVALAAPGVPDDELAAFLDNTADEAERNGFADVAPLFREAAERIRGTRNATT